MKTIKEYLEEIQDPELRDMAIANMDGGFVYANTRYYALTYAFKWSKTKQGSKFWAYVYDSLRRGEQPTYEQFKHLITENK